MSKKTPLYDVHEQLGARIIDFGGYDMPVQYNSIKEEHEAVRERVGMFDVSHMGEFYVRGPQALDLIQKVTINDASKLVDGKAQYTAMCYEDGGIVDDLLVYKLRDEEYMLVVNASNRQKDWDWISQNNEIGAELEDKSDAMCLLAVQGPKSVETLQKLTDTDLSKIGFYSFKPGSLAGYDNMILSATGYTGEKGFELYFDVNDADPAEVWEKIMNAGEEFGIEPAGLGARDTLRLEMGFALYGNDITKDTHPLEARMGWLTKLDKGDFIGKDALLKAKEAGLTRKLMGFEITGRRAIPRKGYDIVDAEGENIGKVTSGSMSITLGKGIGMGYIQIDDANEGDEIFIQVRKKQVSAKVVKPPFIKK
ncbi:MAG: glycine cleavage system aminomethyltransferase GcvT [Bacteroidota bacterium]